MRNLRLLLPVMTALALAIAPAAFGDARSDGKIGALRADDALLVLPIHSTDEFDTIELYDVEHKVAFTIEDVPARLSLAVVKIPAGSYYLRKVVLPNRSYAEFESHRRHLAHFVVTAGSINYAGDLKLGDEGAQVSTSFGGNRLDTLPTLLRREPRLAQDLFTRFPLVLATPLDPVALFGRAPDPGWRLADWLSNIPALNPDAQHALAAAVFKRYGGELPALGASFAAAHKQLETLSKRHTDIEAAEKDKAIGVALAGMWGERGQRLAFELMFIDDKLVEVLVRGSEDNGIWGVPRQDARDDIDAFAAGR